MAKNIGILIDPETGDLQIDPRRNDQNVYVQGLQVGEVTIQNQAAILQAMKGRIERISDPRVRGHEHANEPRNDWMGTRDYGSTEGRRYAGERCRSRYNEQ